MSQVPCEPRIANPFLAELLRAPRPRVPELFCPFGPALHADVSGIQSRSIAWAQRVGLVAGEKAARKVGAAKIGWLPARAYPEGDVELTQLAADWTTLFCLLDDHIERLGSPAAVAAYLAELSALLRGCGEAGDDPTRRACADLRRRLVRLAPPLAVARFNDRVTQLFEAFAGEARVRRAGEVPDLASYLPMREVTVGIHVELEIGELACGVRLGAAARNHPVRIALARMASNIIGWANDIYTYRKELESGEPTNLVAVLALERGLSLEAALAAAADEHDREVRSFIALCGDLPALGDGEGEELRRYASMLRCWVRGHLDWARETGRYDPLRSAPELHISA